MSKKGGEVGLVLGCKKRERVLVEFSTHPQERKANTRKTYIWNVAKAKFKNWDAVTVPTRTATSIFSFFPRRQSNTRNNRECFRPLFFGRQRRKKGPGAVATLRIDGPRTHTHTTLTRTHAAPYPVCGFSSPRIFMLTTSIVSHPRHTML